MESSTCCKFCKNTAQDYKYLYDKNGQRNMEIYEIMIKYFEQKLLTSANMWVICLKCWSHISDFHKFNKTLMITHENNDNVFESYYEAASPDWPINIKVKTESEVDNQSAMKSLDKGAAINSEIQSQNALENPKNFEFVIKEEEDSDGVLSSNDEHFSCSDDEEDVEQLTEECDETIGVFEAADLDEPNALAGTEDTFKNEDTSKGINSYSNSDNQSQSASEKSPNNECVVKEEDSDSLLSSNDQHFDDHLTEECDETIGVLEDLDEPNAFAENVVTFESGISNSQNSKEIETLQNATTKKLKVKLKRLRHENRHNNQLQNITTTQNVTTKKLRVKLKRLNGNQLQNVSAEKKMSKFEQKTCSDADSSNQTACSDYDSNEEDFASTADEESYFLHSESNASDTDDAESSDENEDVKVKASSESSVDQDDSKSISNAQPNNSTKEKEPAANNSKHILDLSKDRNCLRVISKWQKTLACPLCNDQLPNWSQLVEHFKQLHPKDRCYFQCCTQKFHKQFYLAEHARIHLDHNCYKCQICGNFFNSKSELKMHLKRQHLPAKLLDKAFECGICGKFLINKHSLQDHITTVHNGIRLQKAETQSILAQWKNSFKCPLCRENLYNWYSLVDHFKQQHPKDRCYLKCCSRKFFRSFLLAEHARFHMNPDHYKCKVCDRTFERELLLKTHLAERHAKNVQTNKIKQRPDKPDTSAKDVIVAQWKSKLECGLCKEPYATFKLLSSHSNDMHPNHKPHIVCCGRKFESRTAVTDHAKLHLDPNAFKCDICGLFYNGTKQLRCHIRILHNIKNVAIPKRGSYHVFDVTIAKWKPNLDCGICQEPYANFGELIGHFRAMHPNDKEHTICCEHKFEGRSELADHAKIHMDPTAIKCKVCNRLFTIKKNLVTHMFMLHGLSYLGKPIEAKYKCNICGKDFRAPRVYKDHMAAHLGLARYRCVDCKKEYRQIGTLYSHLSKEHPKTLAAGNGVKGFWPSMELDIEIPENITNNDGKENENNTNSSVNPTKIRKLPDEIAKETNDLIAKWKSQLECGICQKSNSTYQLLHEHFQRKHPAEKGFFIVCCKRKHLGRTGIYAHAQYHLDPEFCKCKICNIQYMNEKNFSHHMRKWHPPTRNGHASEASFKCSMPKVLCRSCNCVVI